MREIPVTKTYLPPMNEYISRLEQIWESGWITNMGSQEMELQEELKKYLAVQNLEIVSNGTIAIQLAIRALDLSGEIITTPFSYVATSTAIVWEGCVPIFVDIDENTLCIDPDKIENAITDKTSAILATHVYGFPCDVFKIQKIADKHNLSVIYDAAHCFGVKINNESILNYGDLSTLSFHATKIFHTAEGGAIIVKNEELAKRIYLLKKFGHLGEEKYLSIGINGKISELHAALGLCVLQIVNKRIQEQKRLATLYDKLIADALIARPTTEFALEKNYGYYPVIFISNAVMEKVRGALIDQGIYPRRYFSPSLNTLPFLQITGRKTCPVSEGIASRVLCLPLYFDLGTEEVRRISQIVLDNI